MKTESKAKWWTEIAQLQKQKEVLRIREHMIHRATAPAQRLSVDNDALAELKNVSPEKLAPVVFYSVEHGWKVGYLMQQVGCGGARLLVRLRDWEILRVRTSAVIHSIKPQFLAAFEKVVKIQEDAQSDMWSFLSSMGIQHAAPKAPKSTRTKKKKG
jgi:hypothetical protein